MEKRKGLTETPELSSLVGQWMAKREREKRAKLGKKREPAKMPLFSPSETGGGPVEKDGQ